MSDRDIQGNNSKPSLTPNTQSQTEVKKVQNVEFNEIPTLKDSSPNKDSGIDFYQ